MIVKETANNDNVRNSRGEGLRRMEKRGNEREGKELKREENRKEKNRTMG